MRYKVTFLWKWSPLKEASHLYEAAHLWGKGRKGLWKYIPLLAWTCWRGNKNATRRWRKVKDILWLLGLEWTNRTAKVFPEMLIAGPLVANVLKTMAKTNMRVVIFISKPLWEPCGQPLRLSPCFVHDKSVNLRVFTAGRWKLTSDMLNQGSYTWSLIAQRLRSATRAGEWRFDLWVLY